ncbi:MAG: zf-HC2 domain-containing protein [Candidatus Poribacteria bacterium]|nr:zf-HC2 domain-containing protein [Candidatus Poribacteria bacterium]
MNCEQTLKNLPHFVIEESPEAIDRVSTGTSRRAVLEHLRSCPECQMAYEALWHTASVLESADEPVTPPELAVNIQERVREFHQRRQLAFFANPLSWCLDRLKLDISPRVVNATALIFFLILSGFAAKFAFFTNPSEPESGLIAMKKTMLQNIRISTSPWAVLKDTETHTEEGQMSEQAVIAVQNERNHFFNPARVSSKVWHTDTVDANRQIGEASVANYLQGTVSEKLTVFWNHIKTEL